MLEVRSLEVHYGTVAAVAGIDVEVGDGELVALLGPNGAGKTSTLRAVSQLVPWTGEAIFEGESLRGKTPDDVARRGLIHVPEGRRIFGPLSVHENLQMGLTALGGRRSSYSIDDVYSLFPALVGLRKRPGFFLSGGEQQMVAIGRALVGGPRLLMLDEPSLGLAPIVAKTVFAALKTVSQNTAVLLVEQDAEVALQISARAYVLANGEVALSGAAAELGNREALLASYLGSGPGHV
jgi:branched-chain amino acid transport system ATP-binding protein